MVGSTESNKIEHETIKTVLEKTMFGMTFLKGPDNLNCLIFVH